MDLFLIAKVRYRKKDLSDIWMHVKKISLVMDHTFDNGVALLMFVIVELEQRTVLIG